MRDPAEPFARELLRTRQLLTRIIREMHGDRYVAIHAAIDQERQDRMIKRRGRNLDDALILHPPVLGNDLLNCLIHQHPEGSLVLFREISSFFNQLLRPPVVVHPNQSPPHLNVADVLLGKRAATDGIGAPFVKLEIMRERLEHRAKWSRKESLDDDAAILVGKLIGGLENQLERWIVRLPFRVLFELQN